MDAPVELQDILQDIVKGPDIVWDGAFCYYKNHEILTVFGEDRITLVWVRRTMPDLREGGMLRPEDPQFLTILKQAIQQAKQVVDDAAKRILSKPDAGSVTHG